MLPRPEIQSFTKFLLSVGVFMCAAAFIVPALVLRETTVLRIPEGKLAQLTPVARHELERRQRLARDLGHGAPYMAGVLAAAGVALIGFALPGMRRKERADDAFAAASLEKVLSEVQPQTAEERKEALEAEVLATDTMVEAANAAAVGPEDGKGPGLTSPRAGSALEHVGSRPSDRVRVARDVEERVLSRIARVVPVSRYEFRPNVKVAGPGMTLLLDGLLASRSAHTPDVVIEIKYVGTSPLKNVLNAVNQTLAFGVRYRTRTRRAAIGWLILVLEDEVEDRILERVQAFGAELSEEIVVMTLRMGDIETMTVPVSRLV